MTSLTLRSLCALALCLAALAAALRIPPKAAPEPDDGQLPVVCREPNDPRALAQALDERYRLLRARLEAKQAVVDEVLRGQLTLLEAAAHFHAWNQRPPQADGLVRQCYPGATEIEQVCRQVISFVEGSLEGRPEEAERINMLLETELQRHLHAGTLCLPERSASGTVERQPGTTDPGDRGKP